MADLVVLTIRCAHCSGTVRLYLSGWRDALQHPEKPAERLTVWTCPSCNQTDKGWFPGRLELVDDGVDESS